jgi:hypothetical protein
MTCNKYNSLNLRNCDELLFKLVNRKKWSMATLTTIFSYSQKKGKYCMLFTAKGNITTAEWSARAPTAHVAVRSCRKFEISYHTQFMVSQ